MENRNKIILAGAVVALVIAGAVGVTKAREGFMGHSMQNGRHGMVTKLFDRVDADKNGAVTQAEVNTLRKTEMAKFDASKDGKLSLDEFENLWLSYVRERMVDHFQRLDSDGDAMVTSDEIATPLNWMMSWLDRNDDKKLTRDELSRHDSLKGRNHHRGKDNDGDDN